jgi:hypothetical protein
MVSKKQEREPEVWGFCRKKPIVVGFREPRKKVEAVDTLEGLVFAHKDVHIVMRGIHKELYVIRKDIFEESYDVVGEAEPVDNSSDRPIGCG